MRQRGKSSYNKMSTYRRENKMGSGDGCRQFSLWSSSKVHRKLSIDSRISLQDATGFY